MKTVTIYTAGGMGKFGKDEFDKGNLWREKCKKTLEEIPANIEIEVINPNDYFNFVDSPAKYNSELEVMKFDLYKLCNSDLVIINFNDMYSLGSMAELAIAYDRRIPVIGLNEQSQKLHPWQQCMCERIFTDMDTMLDYVEEFYLR